MANLFWLRSFRSRRARWIGAWIGLIMIAGGVLFLTIHLGERTEKRGKQVIWPPSTNRVVNFDHSRRQRMNFVNHERARQSPFVTIAVPSRSMRPPRRLAEQLFRKLWGQMGTCVVLETLTVRIHHWRTTRMPEKFLIVAGT